MKKFLAILLCLSMLVCMIPLVASAETTPSGTAISTLEELQSITGTGDFYLKNDIYVDLSKLTMAIIPEGFKGNLDGNDHSILFKDENTKEAKNVNTTANLGSILIITKCNAASIKNITIGSADAVPTITTNQANVGLIAPQTNVATRFENVVVYGNITSTRSGTLNYGLMIGKTLNQLKFYDCKAIGSITFSVTNNLNDYVGGFVGQFYGDSSGDSGMTLTVSGCVSNVEIIQASGVSNAFSATAAGGFLGVIDQSTDPHKLNVSNSFVHYTPMMKTSANNPVRCLGTYLGGTFVKVDNATITRVVDDNDVITTNCTTADTLETDLALTTENAASIRFNAPTGIRFYNNVSGVYNTLVKAFGAENVKMGTIIAPKVLIETAGAFTKEALGSLNSTTPTYLDVEFENEWYETDGENNTYTYVGSIVNILEDNYTLEFCGIGYISYNDGTGWKTVYADCGEQGIPAFTVRGLAEAVNADPDATDAEKAAVAKYLAQ